MCLLVSISLPGLIMAQSGTTETSLETQTEDGYQTTKAVPNNQFKAAEQRAEAMRYQHLWIAYSMVWLIIFTFVFRTWKMNQATAGELDSLKKRLAKLESSDGP
jgi:hypothetical protein